MLTRLVIRRLRLLHDVSVDIPVGQPLVLTGAGSTGKSTVLEALGALAALSSGTLRDPLDLASLRTAGQTEAPEVEATLTLPNATAVAAPVTVRYGARLGHGGEAEREWFDVSGDPSQPSSQHVMAGDASMVAYYGTRTEHGGPPHAVILRARAALGSARVYTAASMVPRTRGDRDSAVLAPRRVLDSAGADLVNVLYHLHAEHDAAWSALMDHLRAEFPYVTRLEFPADAAAGRVTLCWRDQRLPNVRLAARQMSDGMTAWLTLLAALLTPERPPVLAIDDADCVLSPTAARRLAALAESAATRSTVVLTTRGDALIQGLTRPTESVQVCVGTETGMALRPWTPPGTTQG